MAYKEQQIEIKQFFEGISDDPRRASVSSASFQISKHFDIFSQPNRLIPYRDLAADTNDGSTATGMKQYAVKDFIYGKTVANLFGLGQNGSGQTKIVYKADPTTGNWTLPASSEGNGSVLNGCFPEYKDYLWGFQGTNQVWKWGTISGGAGTITNTVGTVGSTITSVANGIIGKDDILYLPYNNILAKVSAAGTLTDLALTLPTDIKIVSLTRWNNYLAIGCAPISTFNGRSVVYLWNYTSTDVQEAIDWGDGELRIIETIEGYIFGVTDRYLNNATGAGKGSMIIQAYSGGVPQVLKEVFTQALSGKTMPISKAVKNNRLFFAAKIMTNTAGTTYNEGIWSIGRKNANYPWALTLDIIDENINSSGIQAFGTAANYFFITHSADGSIDKTSATATYTFTSIYESQILDFGDPCLVKKLNQFSIYVAPITAGTVTVKYKTDANTSFTTIGSLSTVGALSRDFINIESTGAVFGTFKEVTFRIESTGGVEPTGYKINTQPLITKS